MKKEKTLMLWVSEEFKTRVQKAATDDNKTLTGYVTDCLLSDLKKRDKNRGIDKNNYLQKQKDK